jgi:pyruvate-formate lyase-activating enzyme
LSSLVPESAQPGSGVVSKILRWSVVDGPGNRLVLFLQGCNFACPGCHNPYTIGQCNDCGALRSGLPDPGAEHGEAGGCSSTPPPAPNATPA